MIHYTYTCDACQAQLSPEDAQEYAKLVLAYVQQNGNSPAIGKDEAFCQKCAESVPDYWSAKAQELLTIQQESARRLENFRRRFFAK